MIARAEDLPWFCWLDLILTLEDQLSGKSTTGIRTFSSIKMKADAISRRSMNVRPERDRSQVDLEVMTEA